MPYKDKERSNEWHKLKMRRKRSISKLERPFVTPVTPDVTPKVTPKVTPYSKEDQVKTFGSLKKQYDYRFT